jgi:hypothetical protein
MSSTTNQVLKTNGTSGTSADPSWSDLSDLLDAALGSTQGNVLYRGASAWTVLSPGVAGALLATGGSSANPYWTGPGQIIGTATNDNASAGNIGEYVSSTVSEASGISLTNGVAFNITSISLSAGDWDVWGSITVDQGSGNEGNLINLAGSITATSETITDFSLGVPGTCQASSITSGAMRAIFNLSPTRFSLNTTTTIYLVARPNYANTSIPGTGYGTLAARRAR